MKTHDEVLIEMQADPEFQKLDFVAQHLCSYPAMIAWLVMALKLSEQNPKEVRAAFDHHNFRTDFRPIYLRILNL